MSVGVAYERVAASKAVATVWGQTALELHDAYWRSMGVSVVRAGAGTETGTGAGVMGLYLLCGRATTVVVDFRKVLEVMGWMGPKLCVVRPEGLAPAAGQTAGESGQASRCGFTALETIAEAWRAGEGRFEAWRMIKRRVEGGAICVAQPAGRVVEDAASGVIFERLATVWADPTGGVEGLKKVRRGVYSMRPDSAGTGKVKPGTKAWLGEGRTLGEVRGAGRVCVLPDVEL